MNNLDMKNLLNLLGKFDKKDLENAISKANEIMNSNNKEQLINDLKKHIN